jgi:hypothetical protein
MPPPKKKSVWDVFKGKLLTVKKLRQDGKAGAPFTKLQLCVCGEQGKHLYSEVQLPQDQDKDSPVMHHILLSAVKFTQVNTNINSSKSRGFPTVSKALYWAGLSMTPTEQLLKRCRLYVPKQRGGMLGSIKLFPIEEALQLYAEKKPPLYVSMTFDTQQKGGPVTLSSHGAAAAGAPPAPTTVQMSPGGSPT